MALIGYCRVSTNDQNLDHQLDTLQQAGCSKIFEDKMSGARGDRPGLTECLEYMRPGDTLVVFRLDRAGRSLQNLIQLVNDLEARNIGFRSLSESMDTSTSGGKLIYSIFASLAEFERAVIRERVSAGLVSARKRGRIGGRPTVVGTSKLSAIKSLTADGLSTKEICDTLAISRATFFRHKQKLQTSR